MKRIRKKLLEAYTEEPRGTLRIFEYDFEEYTEVWVTYNGAKILSASTAENMPQPQGIHKEIAEWTQKQHPEIEILYTTNNLDAFLRKND